MHCVPNNVYQFCIVVFKCIDRSKMIWRHDEMTALYSCFVNGPTHCIRSAHRSGRAVRYWSTTVYYNQYTFLSICVAQSWTILVTAAACVTRWLRTTLDTKYRCVYRINQHVEALEECKTFRQGRQAPGALGQRITQTMLTYVRLRALMSSGLTM